MVTHRRPFTPALHGRVPNDPRQPRVRLRSDAFSAVAPPSANWLTGVPGWPMNGNSTIGDCTAAGAAHFSQMVNWFGQNQNAPVSDADVVAMYSAISGYNPQTGANDNGAQLQDALAYWRKTGLGGNQLAAYAQIDHANLDLVRNCIAIFGGVYCGFNVPATAMDQFNHAQPWTVVPRARIVGGHCVPVMAYDATGFGCVTWGATQRMDLGFFQRYFDEVWVPIDPDWMRAVGTSPAGLDTATLNADFTALTGQPGPFVAPTPQPTPPPAPVPPAPPVPADPTALLTAVAADLSAQAAAINNWLATNGRHAGR